MINKHSDSIQMNDDSALLQGGWVAFVGMYSAIKKFEWIIWRGKIGFGGDGQASPLQVPDRHTNFGTLNNIVRTD